MLPYPRTCGEEQVSSHRQLDARWSPTSSVDQDVSVDLTCNRGERHGMHRLIVDELRMCLEQKQMVWFNTENGRTLEELLHRVVGHHPISRDADPQ